MDLELTLTGDGADLVKTNTDLSVIYGFENMILLAMLGGNVEMDTPETRLENEQDFSFWGNNLLEPQDRGRQFNSQTERALNTIPLTSSGRLLIQQAVENDLAFMEDFAEVDVNVSIVGVDRVQIAIQVQQPDNLQAQDFVYIWDATKQELIKRETRSTTLPTVIREGFFDESFDSSFD